MNTLKQNFLFIWKQISDSNKQRFYMLIVITIFLSLFEAASLGSLVPFLTAMTSPQTILDNDFLMNFLNPIGINTHTELATAATVLFVVITITTGALRFFLLKLQYSFSHLASNDISVTIFDNMINQEYSDISLINSADLTSALSQKITQFINSALLPLLMLMSSIMVFLVLITGLFIIDWKLTLVLAAAFFSTYASISILVRRRIAQNSISMSTEYNILLKSIQETFGGIREIILGNQKEPAKSRFHYSVTNLRAAQASTLFLAACPKMFIEVIAFVSVALIAYYSFSQTGSAIMSIPTLGALAYAAQRMLPIMQQVYANRLSILGCEDLIQDLCDLLAKKSNKKKENASFLIKNSSKVKTFTQNILLKDLFYRYPGVKDFTLKNINLTINAGDRIGIYGRTGSGKSTLLDVIMGLLQPTTGEIICDGESHLNISREEWYKVFSHVPQSIFLADTSIFNNIGGFGNNSTINHDKVLEASELAHIKEDIERLDNGFETIVGERGVRLSGGQLQRIGIARAIYEPSNILVLDEATSAIDPLIEKKIEDSLNALKKDVTIIKVAHRISTLEGCNIIYEVSDGQIVRSGDYETLFGINSKS